MGKNNAVRGLLRFFAACVIAIVYHYTHFLMISAYEYPFPAFTVLYSYGYLAVEFFFMVSGFDLSAGYCKQILDGEVSFSDFN